MNRNSHSTQTFVIACVMFVMGGCGMAYEYTLSKIASDILGNSVQQWAIIIAVMLFCMGVGAELQKHISDKKMVSYLVYSQIVLAILGGFASLILLHVFSAFPSHFAVVQYALVSTIGTMIGFEIPLLTRINENYSTDVKDNLARILKMDYIGALIGALLWVFLLFRYFPMMRVGFILGLTTLASTLVFVWAFRKNVERIGRVYGAIALATVLVIAGLWQEKSWTAGAEQRLYRDRIVFSETTQYQHIVLTESHAGTISCYINGHLQFNGHDEHIYHENLVHPAMEVATRRDRVLILGGGDGLALREVLKYPDVQSITLVDLDPQMTELAKENPHFVAMNEGGLSSAKVKLIANESASSIGQQSVTISNSLDFDPEYQETVATVEVLNMDAARFVAQAEGRFDVIIIDFPDPNSVELTKLYSQHFYGFLREKLAADGIYVQQSTSPFHAKEAFLCIGRTIESAGLVSIPFHDNVPSFGEWGWWIGCRNDHRSEAVLRAQLEGIPTLTTDTRYLTPELIKASFQFGKNQLETDQDSVNTITNPCIYNYYLQAWKQNRGLL